MAKVRNILFIMCDQLRADYLGCEGHPHLETPHIDALAERGVGFTRAYCQSPVCGPSRMSFYTGRYMFSHGANWNNIPLRVDEWTMGDYLRPLGMRVALVGKTHMTADDAAVARLEVTPESAIGRFVAECGFEAWERDDGLHPEQIADPDLAYNRYLRDLGFEGENPWHTAANSAEGPDGEILSGWHMRNARLPTRVPEEHSETAYMTNRAMAFIAEAGETPWCLHLSYIKPHWPYIAPAPYNDMYGANQVVPANRHPGERADPHPVHAAFMTHDDSLAFQSEEVRHHVIPTYMGLVKQIDDHIGRLMAFLRDEGRLDDTMIVFTADHGDYLGDHWLGEKELFHEAVARIPMIVVDPDASAEATRGVADPRLVEAVDLLPTFLEAKGGAPAPLIAWRAAPSWRCCARAAWRPGGARRCSAKRTIPSARRAWCSTWRRVTRAPSWFATSGGNTAITRAFPHSSSTSRRIRASCATSAATRRSTASARRCTSDSSPGYGPGGRGSRSRTRKSRGAPARGASGAT